MDNEVFSSAFSQYGTVTDVYNSGKGFAFVTYSSKDEASQAIGGLNGQTLGNQEIKVSEADPMAITCFWIPEYWVDFDYTEEDRIMFSYEKCDLSCNLCDNYFFRRKWPAMYQNVRICDSWKCDQKHFHKHVSGVCYTAGVFAQCRKKIREERYKKPR